MRVVSGPFVKGRLFKKEYMGKPGVRSSGTIIRNHTPRQCDKLHWFVLHRAVEEFDEWKRMCRMQHRYVW